MKKLTRIPNSDREGFSLMEIMAAVVIVAVVATASVSGLSTLRGKTNVKLDETNIADLTSKVEAYRLEHGRLPDTNMWRLIRTGYVTRAELNTPYGGRYTFDTATNKVVNKNAP